MQKTAARAKGSAAGTKQGAMGVAHRVSAVGIGRLSASEVGAVRDFGPRVVGKGLRPPRPMHPSRVGRRKVQAVTRVERQLRQEPFGVAHS